MGELKRISNRFLLPLSNLASFQDATKSHEHCCSYSEVMLDVFGEAGRSARSAIGHATLPFGVPIEVLLPLSSLGGKKPARKRSKYQPFERLQVEAIVQVELGPSKI